MKTVFVIEHMAKRERTLPTRHWRVAERQIIERPDGRTKMLKSDWRLLAKDLTLAKALHVVLQARSHHIQPQLQLSRA